MGIEEPNEEKVLNPQKVAECADLAEKITVDFKNLKTKLEELGLPREAYIADQMLVETLELMWKAKGGFKTP